MMLTKTEVGASMTNGLTRKVGGSYASTSPYDRGFYDAIRAGSRRSAQVVAPIVLQLVGAQSIVDVGCGDGTWLAEFMERGVTDAVGLDGDYVDRRTLRIPQDQFKATDLSLAFEITRTFDLAISLEVAEHLPAQSAEGFVESITKLAPVILFSAAIPYQGGNAHLNEQWPEYWANLFSRRGYMPIDCIRPEIWNNEQVEWWYCQNCFIYAERAFIERHAALRAAHESTNLHQLQLVHPRNYANVAPPRQPGIREASVLLAQAVLRSARRRLKSGVTSR